MEDSVNNSIALLQLQRSALIDTQTLFQLLIDAEICSVQDIVETRSKIESSSPDIKRIDEEIAKLGGNTSVTPVPEDIVNKVALRQQVKELQTMLNAILSDDKEG